MKESETVRQNLIKNLTALNKELPTKLILENTNVFQTITQHSQQVINQLIAKNPDRETASLIFHSNLLNNRLLLSKLPNFLLQGNYMLLNSQQTKY